MARKRLNFYLGRRTFIFSIVVVVAIAAGSWLGAQEMQLDSDAVLNHLNAAIRWYRQVDTVDVAAGQPSDSLYLQNARSYSSQALQLAFQSAEAEATLAASQKEGTQPSGDQESSAQENLTQPNLAKAAADASDRIQKTQARIDDLSQQIQRASGKKAQELISQREGLLGELELDKTQQEALTKIQAFASNSENVKTGLLGKINELKQSVPELAAYSGKPPANNGQTTKSTRADRSGLIGQTSVLFSQMGDVHDIDQLISETSQLRDTAERLQAPLRAGLRTTIQQGRDAASQPSSSDPAQTQQLRRTLAQLTAKFKRLSNAAVPLRQEIIVLDQCRANLVEWRSSVIKEYKYVLRSLLTRVGIILAALGIIAFFSALWRRATLRYIHDPRRRRQVLLIRRFVIGFLMSVVVSLGFISEFSSLATFAGFITAGLAVALQTVILSIAAYFFLVGRYGVRVGDRITVSGVTGDVIDVGLVRLSLMELAGTGIDLYPTGRAVVFSNSVLFQPTPLYKQLPGTSYTWHEVAIALSPEADAAAAEKELLEPVNSVYEEYSQNIRRQHRAVEQLMDASLPVPAPQSQLRFGETGLEFVVRYPVEIRRAPEIDDKVTRKLIETISRSPNLQAAAGGPPKLRSAIRA